MGKHAGRPSILARRWVWTLVLIAAVFVAGVAVGVTGHGGDSQTPCPATPSTDHRGGSDG